MKKSILLVILVVLCASLLISCGCKHEQWKEADCETAKTCIDCGETTGEALGHKWIDATCTTAKTCSVCQKTDGAALGHKWVDAACETPKTCQACGLTEGDALGHTWVDATTEAPKTCTTCNQTEGERIITDSRFTTAECQSLFGTWVLPVPISGEMTEMEGFNETLNVNIYLNFSNDGYLSIYTKMENADEFNAALKTYMLDAMYEGYKLNGVSKEDADAEMLKSSGMTVEQYVDYILDMIDFSVVFEMINAEYCYYVIGNQLYMSPSWEQYMDPVTFRFQNDQLIIEALTNELDVTDNAFTRVPDNAG